jgi:trehalose 6-phosphate phosphatase
VNERPDPANDPDRTDGGGAPHASAASLASLPSALPVRDRLGDRLTGDLAIFLDYDGTLTPIVDDPDAALIPPATRATIQALADATLVAIVSGRDLDDVRAKVGVPGIAYAGSHGFDILHPDGSRHQLATAHVEVLDEAERVLLERLADVAGARVERKRFAIAVHDRQVSDAAVRERIEATVREVGAAHDELRVTGGKRIHELRPAIDWDKGRAIDALLVELDAADRLPIYLGDDLTDEDGFRAVVAHGGLGVVVRGEDDDRDTLASVVLDTPDDARRFLDELRELVTQR